MLITDIEITQYRYCPETARHLASVQLTLQNRMITLFCRLLLPEDTDPRHRAAAFVGDAMRQLRRMPEYRPGRVGPQLAGNLAVAPLPQLA